MKLSDQVCTIEQAKHLKELGVIQKSIFYWHPSFESPVLGERWTTRFGTQYATTQVCNDKKGSASAYTVAELGVMLPEYTGDQWFLEMYKDNETRFLVRYVDNDGLGKKEIKAGCNRPTEAEARADLLIHLLETKTITAEEVNKRLQQ